MNMSFWRRRNSRGQVIPVWLALCSFALTFGLLLTQYGATVAGQVRAQSAADTVARAAVAIQSQKFNETLLTLYALGVEEYRIRHLIESLRITAASSGGCNAPGVNDCQQVWNNLTLEYNKAVRRYDNASYALETFTNNLNFSSENNDAQALVNKINGFCVGSGGSSGGTFQSVINCGQKYSRYGFKLSGFTYRNNLSNAIEDPTNIVLPGYYNTGSFGCAGGTQYPVFNCQIWGPVAAEVEVCEKIPSQFLSSVFPATYVYARGAAADAMVEQDWLSPGQQKNPFTGQYFQPTEIYGPNDPSGFTSGGSPLNWYSVNYGGTPHTTTANSNNSAPFSPQNSTITAGITNEEYLARTGWWGPIPILPFTPAPSQATLQGICPS